MDSLELSLHNAKLIDPDARFTKWGDTLYLSPTNPEFHGRPYRLAKRRAEQENLKMRREARKKASDDVRTLVAFVKRRDPRVKAQHVTEQRM